MPSKAKRKRATVPAMAALLCVSTDTIHELLAKGEMPGRKVGRRWLTTKAAGLRWIEKSSPEDRLARAVAAGDMDALAEQVNAGGVRWGPSPHV